MSKQLKTWQYVRNVGSIQNLPPYTMIGDATFGEQVMHIIIPDVSSVSYALQKGKLEHAKFIRPGYKGLCVEVSDRGNITLYMQYKNGNKREIWGIV